MAEEQIFKEKALKKFKPNEYRIWVIQAKSTFEVHKCLCGIVGGTEVNPTPPPGADGAPV